MTCDEQHEERIGFLQDRIATLRETIEEKDELIADQKAVMNVLLGENDELRDRVKELDTRIENGIESAEKAIRQLEGR